jgi:hypothetical protein
LDGDFLAMALKDNLPTGALAAVVTWLISIVARAVGWLLNL